LTLRVGETEFKTKVRASDNPADLGPPLRPEIEHLTQFIDLYAVHVDDGACHGASS